MRGLVAAIAVCMGALALSARAQDAPPPPADPGPIGGPARTAHIEQLLFMAGTWRGELLGGTFEEHWMRPRGGLVLGCGRLIRDGKAVFHEYLRIEAKDDTLVYTVQPMGREPVSYTLENFEYFPPAGTARFTWRNDEHPRQHTIEYARNGDAIAGRIAGTRDGQDWEQRFAFTRAPDGRPTPDEPPENPPGSGR